MINADLGFITNTGVKVARESWVTLRAARGARGLRACGASLAVGGNREIGVSDLDLTIFGHICLNRANGALAERNTDAATRVVLAFHHATLVCPHFITLGREEGCSGTIHGLATFSILR